VFKRINKCVN